jgi:DNA-nicking Smr family endonuclease
VRSAHAPLFEAVGQADRFPPRRIPALSGRRRTVVPPRRIGDRPMKLKLDLHDIYNRGQDIDRALRDIIDEAVRKKAPVVEIIPGKGSGQLKKHVIRFLEQKEIKALYHRVEKDSKNFGRLFVHFRWK